jgi:hypothetical protein
VAGALLALDELADDTSSSWSGVRRHDRDSSTSCWPASSRRSAGARPLESSSRRPSHRHDRQALGVLRGKPDSSMVVGLKLQAEGGSDAFVSPATPGAQMALSVLTCAARGPHAAGHRDGLPDGPRAGRRARFRRQRRLLPRGAGAVRAARRVYAEDMLGRQDPAVGLLSIGEEPEKGNAAVKEAHQLLRAAGLNFVGNVEGRDIPRAP